MKILYIHNAYAKMSGEEHASRELAALLEEHGHKVEWFTRSSEEISGSRLGMVKSFFTGIHNPSTRAALEKVLDSFAPDVAIVQNLYPLISSAVFKPLKKRGIPVVMRCPNYRLFCPGGLCLDNDGKVCEKCFGGGKELWCVAGNCEKSIAKSTGYAVRNAFNRITKRILKGVDVFIVQSEFQKQKFIAQGIPADKIGIVSGISPVIDGHESVSCPGEWVSFVGRVSQEKGIDEFIEAARRCRDIPFRVAGNIDANYVVPGDLPDNLKFVGFLKGDDLNDFYRNSRIIVVPSKWYEGFPNVITRGMLLQRPVITTDIGAMQSIVDDGVNGLKVPPADGPALARAIATLYPDIDRCRMMGENGRQKALTEYSRESIYRHLMAVIDRATGNDK